MSRPEQWCLNVCLVLFMSIAVFVAIVLVTLTITKAFIVDSLVPFCFSHRQSRESRGKPTPTQSY